MASEKMVNKPQPTNEDAMIYLDQVNLLLETFSKSALESRAEIADTLLAMAAYLLERTSGHIYIINDAGKLELSTCLDSTLWTEMAHDESLAYWAELLRLRTSGIVSGEQLASQWKRTPEAFRAGAIVEILVSGEQAVGIFAFPLKQEDQNICHNLEKFFRAVAHVGSTAFKNADAIRLQKDVARQYEQKTEETERLLRQTVDQLKVINDQKEAIRSMSTPILQVWDGVLVLPVVGIVDSERSTEMTEKLLESVVANCAHVVIIDITGIEMMDTQTADHFIKMTRAVRLLGASPVITGISPSIAQTLTHLEIDLAGIKTLLSLRDALMWFFRQHREKKDKNGN